MSGDETITIQVGHSPDPDDAFMFHALANDCIDTGRYRFTHELVDIETLNYRAFKGELELTAVSLHGYAHLTDIYAICSCGASMGDNYGPMVVAREPWSIDDLRGKTIAVPGTLTTAFLSLKLLLGDDFEYVVHPFDQLLDIVEAGGADASLIIHEGQLTFENEGLVCCEDLGVWWGRENDGLPLPLGGNVIHKRIPAPERKVISDVLERSIRYSLEHRSEAVEHSLQYARDMGIDLADKFVGMYVNDWTLDYGEPGRESIRRFLRRGHEMGVVPELPELEFVE